MSTIIRIAVSGSRTIVDRELVYRVLDGVAIPLVMAGDELEMHLGDAIGVDALARDWARERAIRRIVMFADRKGYTFAMQAAGMREFHDAGAERNVLASDWDREGLRAGPIRNHAMLAGMRFDADDRPCIVNRADRLVAVWDGTSRRHPKCPLERAKPADSVRNALLSRRCRRNLRKYATISVRMSASA